MTGTQQYDLEHDIRTYNKKVQVYDLTSDSWFTAPIEQQLPLYPNMGWWH